LSGGEGRACGYGQNPPGEERAHRQRPDYGSSDLGSTVMSVNRSQNQGSDLPSVRTCQSCAHYVSGLPGNLGGRCTVGMLLDPVTGDRKGGDPSRPLTWQQAIELRTSPSRFTTCGQHGDLWKAIF